MTPFDRAEAAWESTWIDGPDFDREDDGEDLDPFPSTQATEPDHDDDIPF